MPVLTLFTIAVLSTLFYAEVPVQFQPSMQMAALALLLLQLVQSLLKLSKNNRPEQQPEPEPVEVPQPAAAVQYDSSDDCDAAVVQLMARLQEKGRLIDFVMDDISAYDNESVGAAARIVHQGCCDVVADYFTIAPVYDGEEMEEIRLEENYDSSQYRLTGQVPDQPPYEGQVLHRGWKTALINRPQMADVADAPSLKEIIAPAEVEVTH
ncbi:DUF2760 domain-containing protein [Desulfuromonas acetoxidans]|uniref:DUF2760 domain-containing protein n=1 Tax=Desulfuromonas acetoxidans (strain DSM 684 / 11070) TaxID=281689 RepID=Q1K496_DESA6|nr:DUF2760 domain-containing protein [Desulfuromonas acetoxidans]EAT17207.1 conserved hypothetical protein [Desulfuromonas acetoxidans DSM 684]MBF0645397.1 DUF2760 domain-containing protein [Desulfuromonas acetoxidans]NVD24203.1 DUF2760 domain-containing protein [Desulfuromonas acetoxidans]NVE15024.1 DUF2760 domain-containing protein [Desulfuromonas acetoxidans]